MDLQTIAKKLAVNSDATINIDHVAEDDFAVTVTISVLPVVKLEPFAPYLGKWGMAQVAFRINVSWDLLTHQTFLPNLIKEYRKKCETTAS